jgi:hypothetical protein
MHEYLGGDNMNQEFKLKFSWHKPEKGYIWEDCEILIDKLTGVGASSPPSGPYLVERDYSQGFIPYSPFDDSTLFARFADIDTEDKEALCAFASGHGRLVAAEKLPDGNSLLVLPGNSTLREVKERHIHHLGIRKGDVKYAQFGESLGFWQNEHHDLSFAALAWELAANQDAVPLGKAVRWIIDNKGVEIVKFPRKMLAEIDDGKLSDFGYCMDNHIGRTVLFDSLNIRAWASSRYRYPDVIGPARLYVQTAVNEKLLKYPLQIALTLDEQGNLYKRLCPTSLLSAMWYQLYLALVGDISLRRCSICGKWEDMKGHRVNWCKHKKCVSYERLGKCKLAPDRPLQRG